jgi:hypothetical protein
VDYPGPVAAATADMPTIKILLNAVVSEQAQWMTIDIKDYYLGTPLPRTEYMRLQRKHIPACTVKHFALEQYWHHDTILVAIDKGIYGLPQAGRLAQERLFRHLAQHGYYVCPATPCLLRHRTRDIAFTLVVDDFGIKYQNQEDADHLIDTLQQLYIIKVNWTGNKYLGMHIKHDQQQQTINISLPFYIKRALERFQVVKLPHVTDSPATPPVTQYGKRQQALPEDLSAPLDAAGKLRLQQIVGTLLYYARAIDSTMLTTLSKLGSAQAKPTEATNKAAERLLQYAANWPNASVTFRASDMKLHLQSDASFNAEPDGRSRAGGVHSLGTFSETIDDILVINGCIDTISVLLPSVVASAAEAEYGALFLNGQAAEAHRQTLNDLGYPQGKTPMLSDNSHAVGTCQRAVKLRKSKSYDLRYHWIRDRCDQGHFGISWAKGKSNLADFLTKTHPVKHFKNMRSFFVQDAPLDVPRNTALTRRNFKKSQLPVTTVPSANSGTRFQKGVLEQPTAAGISWFPGFVGANRFAPLAFTNQ